MRLKGLGVGGIWEKILEFSHVSLPKNFSLIPKTSEDRLSFCQRFFHQYSEDSEQVFFYLRVFFWAVSSSQPQKLCYVYAVNNVSLCSSSKFQPSERVWCGAWSFLASQTSTIHIVLHESNWPGIYCTNML